MKRANSAWLCCGLFGLSIVPTAQAALQYQTIDDPLGIDGTALVGLSNGLIVGNYFGASDRSNGFIYNGTTFTTLDYPNAVGIDGTQITGISGNTIVGNYQANNQTTPHPFTYANGVFTTLPSDPAALAYTSAEGVSGGTIVGTYLGTDNAYHGFTYTAGVYTTFSDPSATNGSTDPIGIDGKDIVGYEGGHAFLYNGTTFSSITLPNSTLSGGTKFAPQNEAANAMSGSLIAGEAQVNLITTGQAFPETVEYGFVYDGANFTLLQDPDAGTAFDGGTKATGIDGQTVVGSFTGPNYPVEGFEVVLPEPAAPLFLLAGVPLLLQRRRQAKPLIAVDTAS